MKPISKKVLIVDDEENARLYLSGILNELFPEVEVQMSESPVDAIEKIIKFRPEIILLDVEMPGMTGLELLKQLRQLIMKTPVVFVSAYKRAEFIQNALRLNAVDYIDKPVDPEELKVAMCKCFEFYNTNSEQINQLIVELLTERGTMQIDSSEIMYFESDKRNAICHFTNGFSPIIIRNNLQGLEKTLPPLVFERVSRQYIVNKKYVKIYSRCNLSIVLNDGHKTIKLFRIYPQIFK